MDDVTRPAPPPPPRLALLSTHLRMDDVTRPAPPPPRLALLSTHLRFDAITVVICVIVGQSVCFLQCFCV